MRQSLLLSTSTSPHSAHFGGLIVNPRISALAAEKQLLASIYMPEEEHDDLTADHQALTICFLSFFEEHSLVFAHASLGADSPAESVAWAVYPSRLALRDSARHIQRC